MKTTFVKIFLLNIYFSQYTTLLTIDLQNITEVKIMSFVKYVFILHDSIK